MKRSYVLYTTLFAVVVGLALCYVFVFSDKAIQQQIASTFEKIDIQTSHQTTSLPPVEASADDEDIDTTDALEQIENIDEVYYSDTIGAYLVLTSRKEFFEVSGNGNRVNATLQLTNTPQQRLDSFIGMRMVSENRVYALTARGILLTIEREDGRWVEKPRKQVKGIGTTDRLFGLGYDAETNRLIVMNRPSTTSDLEILYVEERELPTKAPKADETNETPPVEETPSKDAPANDVVAEGEAEKESETDWLLQTRVPLSADGMSASIQQKFEKFVGVGLVERQGRLYVLDSEELVLYTINPEEATVNGQMVTPRVYDSTGMFLQDNGIFAIVRPEVFDLDAFVSVD